MELFIHNDMFLDVTYTHQTPNNTIEINPIKNNEYVNTLPLRIQFSNMISRDFQLNATSLLVFQWNLVQLPYSLFLNGI